MVTREPRGMEGHAQPRRFLNYVIYIIKLLRAHARVGGQTSGPESTTTVQELGATAEANLSHEAVLPRPFFPEGQPSEVQNQPRGSAPVETAQLDEFVCMAGGSGSPAPCWNR